jgi:hypothetical protein
MNSIKKITALSILAVTLVSTSSFALDPPKTEDEKTFYPSV